MKMPSTYISLLLLLLGGLVFVFLHHPHKPGSKPTRLYNNTTKIRPLKQRLRDNAGESGFSFLRDVVLKISFEKDAQGQVSKVFINMNGKIKAGKKIK
jgi:hypothetical protein